MDTKSLPPSVIPIDSEEDALRWQHLCNAERIPQEFVQYLMNGAPKYILDAVIDSARNATASTETLN